MWMVREDWHVATGPGPGRDFLNFGLAPGARYVGEAGDRVRVTGHFDDPAAASCPEPGWNGKVPNGWGRETSRVRQRVPEAVHRHRDAAHQAVRAGSESSRDHGVDAPGPGRRRPGRRPVGGPGSLRTARDRPRIAGVGRFMRDGEEVRELNVVPGETVVFRVDNVSGQELGFSVGTVDPTRDLSRPARWVDPRLDSGGPRADLDGARAYRPSPMGAPGPVLPAGHVLGGGRGVQRPNTAAPQDERPPSRSSCAQQAHLYLVRRGLRTDPLQPWRGSSTGASPGRRSTCHDPTAQDCRASRPAR